MVDVAKTWMTRKKSDSIFIFLLLLQQHQESKSQRLGLSVSGRPLEPIIGWSLSTAESRERVTEVQTESFCQNKIRIKCENCLFALSPNRSFHSALNVSGSNALALPGAPSPSFFNGLVECVQIGSTRLESVWPEKFGLQRWKDGCAATRRRR